MSYPMSMDLQHKQTQSLKQTQRMIMSPQMQQAIHLLQLPIMELSALVETELEQNPVLEHAQDEDVHDADLTAIQQDTAEESQDKDTRPEQELSFDDRDFEIMKQLDEDYRDYFAESSNYVVRRSSEDEKFKTYQESSITAELTLFEHLMKQAGETFDTPEDLALAEALIGNFDERGYLLTPISEIALLNSLDESRLEKVLVQIQDFSPFGVGAKNLQESLLIQLRCLAKKNTLAYDIIEKHFEDLIHNRIPLIQKGLKCSSEEIAEAIDRCISKLDLHPGTLHSRQIVQAITPDVTVRQEDDKLIVDINDDSMPSLRFNSRYMRMLDDETLSTEAKEFIRHKILSAKWLLRNIHQRNETLEKIAHSLIKRQQEFFLNPEGKLVPLTMKTISEELGLHESTIARAVANKYVDCARGLLPLRSFFTNSLVNEEGEDVSSRTVKDVLLAIIHDEDKRKPLSDEVISKMIKAKGINCARRTVAKYRALLNIGNTQQRRKF